MSPTMPRVKVFSPGATDGAPALGESEGLAIAGAAAKPTEVTARATAATGAGQRRVARAD